MRIMKAVLFTMLVQSFFGTGILNAKQQVQTQSARNSNASLAREVHHELALLPWLSVFDNLQSSVHGNEVTLSGQVVQPSLKSDAENAVKHIEGVNGVNNQIEVLPNSPMDDQIRRAEYRAIYSQENLSRYSVGAQQSIHIVVKGGHVTLEGTVERQEDKDSAGIYAKTVPDVFSVENDLTVTGSK